MVPDWAKQKDSSWEIESDAPWLAPKLLAQGWEHAKALHLVLLKVVLSAVS